MHSAKEQMSKIIHKQPDDSSYDEVLRELTFARMVERGIGVFHGALDIDRYL